MINSFAMFQYESIADRHEDKLVQYLLAVPLAILDVSILWNPE
jgi:hypothetical protein